MKNDQLLSKTNLVVVNCNFTDVEESKVRYGDA